MSTLYCPQCGYNLTGLIEERCPECGAGFDREALRRMAALGIRPRRLARHLLLTPVLFALGAPCCIGAAAVDDKSVSGVFMAVFWLGFIFLHAAALADEYVRVREVRGVLVDGPWVFRGLWRCAILFTLIEAAVALVYFGVLAAVLLGAAML